MFSDEDGFCNSSFWDSTISWDTDNPRLPLCFEKTALLWGPCLLLWLFTPLELSIIFRSKCRDVPWGFTNTTKLCLNLVLIVLSVTSFVWSLTLSMAGEKVYPVDLWTPAVTSATFVLTLVLLIWDMQRGLQSSAVLFLFWLILSTAGVAQFFTEFKDAENDDSEESLYRSLLYMFRYPFVVLMFILNIFADPPPKVTNYPKSQKLWPELQASFASRVIFGWFDQLILKGYRKSLNVADLWDLCYQDTSVQIVRQFERTWAKYYGEDTEAATSGLYKKFKSYGTLKNTSSVKKKKVTILWPIWGTFWGPIMSAAVIKIIGDIVTFVNPQILKLMIQFVESKEYMWRGFAYAIGIFIFAEMQSIFFHQQLMSMYRVGLNWRTAITFAVYKKSLRISNAARKKYTMGEVVNLMAVDAQRCNDFASFCHFTWTTPFIILAVLYFLWQILGLAALAGLAIMLIIIPINALIGKKVKHLQMEQMTYKDERVKMMNEVLTGIKVLKLYAWDPSFRNQILKIREKEIRVLKSAAMWNASISFLWLCSSFLVSLVTFAVFVIIDERNVLTPEIAFVATALFNIMRTTTSQIPTLVQLLLQFLVSYRRIDEFMNAEELDLNSVSHDESKSDSLIMEGGTFSWGTAKEERPVLCNITLKIQPGQLVAVVGAVGSGKSSLISAFLGEMDKISGYVNTKGTIAYVPQQAWIQNATLRDNILFGSSFNNKKYINTVESCALTQDFDMLPGGDSTEIGEKGINLSGGQKQRVSLARAIYSDADIYLLDDPLSAVDANVGKHIFENVIGPRGVLRKKTRILVTHGVTFLSQVDKIIVLKRGEITEEGTFKELMAKKGEFSAFLVQHITATDDPKLQSEIEDMLNDDTDKLIFRENIEHSKTESTRSSNSSLSKLTVDSDDDLEFTSHIDRLIQAEKTETGSVKWSVYTHYLKSAGILLCIATVGFMALFQAFSVLSNIWLSDWTNDKAAAVDGVQVPEKRSFYLEIYTLYGVGQVAAVLASAYSLAFATVLASQHLHLSMLTNVLRSPMSFFDTTPTGRIVNRFGKDIEVVDNTLPFSVNSALSMSANVVGTLVVITWSTPAFASIIIPVGLLYYLLQKFYVTTSRQLKRIESVSRSPVFSHFSETVSALFAVLERDTLKPGIVGLSISYALQITGMLNLAVRMASDIETNIVSVERIKEYTEIPQEGAWEVQPRPDPKWPAHGTVEFKDFQVRYRAGLELVLRGVSFVIKGQEKIGIVGRTGAGKSSLTLSLFRILEAAGGHIYIDGLDISKIGLGDLRSRLTIIPQDPVLFSGSLRMNLDPFEMYNDSDLWHALDLAHLGLFIRSQPQKLFHTISEGGDNLSVGQRQLVCLARALLRKTQILILDEATAAIDLETDDLIQQTIREEYKDCTVLTIAHRLNTIIDSDRVIVLDEGKVKEFDSPSNLLKRPTSIFHGMAKHAGLI
ncbi:multidrug resistance-associated protein 1-like isoform X2 [Homalodisca vitripennis]|uniref:multidrug resistance-associated protein 1-like isoform X2 n=1 Tax=Homalodisca vitripennis TaxID=197043 RepID=UPI001EEAFF60|nr:multidrug resistance-associated protein 1-like isoform X2 [Homalodisca vitripennis]